MTHVEKDGLKYIMQEKEKSAKSGEFPTCLPITGKSYSETYHDIEVFMNTNIHPHVVEGAAIAGDGMLNDHGAGHIAMVIERAQMILGEKAEELKGYEIFFLLLSIHFHDVGNIYGRDDHEERISNVFEALDNSIPLDSITQRWITRIAMSHGGKIDGSKDTLSHLPEEEHINGILIRPLLLASILRFADEIADDKNRTPYVLRALDKIPEKNRVFHEYSASLEPPVLEGNTLKLQYSIRNELVGKKVSKLSSEIFLYDEMLLRLQKCMCELEYCKRYSQGFINISRLSVTVSVLDVKGRKIIYEDRFQLKLKGYPQSEMFKLTDCSEPKIKSENGEALFSNILGGQNE